ncbi:MAG: hypothetical protein ACREE1_02615 [Stellaceae bacterium]
MQPLGPQLALIGRAYERLVMAIADTVTAQWPPRRRSMRAAPDDPAQRPLVWAEHRAILCRVLASNAAGAGRAAVRARRDWERRFAPALEPAAMAAK